jgi:hypothetical protein
MKIIQLLANGSNGSTIYTSLESALNALNFFPSLEILYMSIYMAVSFSGIVLNAFSVYIFYRPSLNSPTSPALFSYMRYETMIGVLGNLVGAFTGFNSSPSILPFVNNYIGQWIQIYLMSPLYNMSYYAKFLIEIAIVVDRILMLTPTFGARWGINDLLKVRRPYLVLITVCALSALVNYPFIYLMNTTQTAVLVNYGYPGYRVYTYFLNSRSTWSNWSNTGYFLMLSIYILKHAVTFFLETVLNVISLVLFQRHFAQKAKLTIRSLSAPKQKQSTSVSASQEMNRESPGGHKMAYLVLFMSASGFLHSLILLSHVMYSLIYPKPGLTVKTLLFCGHFASAIRHAVNFVQFYWFNSAFRKEARALLAKMELISNP